MNSVTTNDDDWDPMKEDFNNPNFNTYIEGPGANLDLYFQPCNINSRREQGKYIELFVSNIPSDLTENGIRNLFIHFGKPIRVHKPQQNKSDHSYAFVSFAHHSEAEASIRGLDKAKPFNLRVKYALTTQEKDALNKFKEHNESVIKTLSEEPSNLFNTTPKKTGISRGNIINKLTLERIVKNSWKNLRKPNNEPIGKMRLYKNSKYENVNTFLCEEYTQVRLQMDETECVNVLYSLTRGRGHILPSSKLLYKNENPSNIKNIPKTFGELTQIESNQECIRCGFLAQICCSGCNSPYCSNSCQMNDWIEHKSECKKSDHKDEININNLNSQDKIIEEKNLNGIMNILIILQYNDFEYWVIQKDNLQTLTNLNEKIQKYSSNANDTKLEIGDLCAVKINENWLRGKIISLIPKIMVKLIDYGDDYYVKPNQIRTLPLEIQSIQGLAFRIKIKYDLPDYFHELKEGTELKIKILKKSSQGYYVVDIMNSLEENKCTTHFKNFIIPKAQRPTTSILNIPKKTALGRIKFISQMRGKRSGTVNLSFSSFDFIQNQLDDLTSFVANISANNRTNWRPRENMIICACYQGNWFRAYLIGSVRGIHLVALCDLGIVVLTKTICPAPKHYCDLPELSVFCRIPESENISWEDAKKCNEYDCKIIFSKNQIYVCEILTNGLTVASLELEPWEPKVEDFGYHLVSISNNSEVAITSYHSQNWVSIRSLEQKNNENFNKFLQDINLHCSLVEYLNRPPYLGELVGCQFSGDGNWYRAYINGIENEKAHVFYIDYGNQDIVSIKTLKPLSTTLKLTAVQSMLVQLKDVQEGYINQQIINFFFDLIINQIPLKIEYTDDDITLPLKLYLKKNKDNLSSVEHTVNSKLNQLIIPDWKKLLNMGKNPSEKVFMSDQIKTIPISKGEKFQLVILTFLELPHFLGVRFDSDITFTVLNTLSEEIQTYTEAITVEPYVPRPNEVCLAYYYKDDKWYRAVSHGSNPNTCRVTFIDYGYQDDIEYINIRKMIPDFMVLPNIGIICQINGLRLDNINNKTEIDKISNLLKINTIYSAEIVSVKNGIAFIELPDMKNQLEQFMNL